MLGTDREPGIMARALNDLFNAMDRTKEDMKYKVSMSYLEVRMKYMKYKVSMSYLEVRMKYIIL